MKSLNRILSFITGAIILTACSSEVPNTDKKEPTVETDIAAAQPTTSTQSKLDLPFVGERLFDFVGANATMESITIDSNGHTIIEGQAGNSSYVIYEGMYSPIMPRYEGEFEDEGYYSIIGNNTIAQLDNNKNLMHGDGCNIEDGKPCVTEFFLND